jgi:hypothetical protein
MGKTGRANCGSVIISSFEKRAAVYLFMFNFPFSCWPALFIFCCPYYQQSVARTEKKIFLHNAFFHH